ncbi:MAG: universal stress protein [Polyangiaceae bacterium]|jgi:nucleotide-binding universal stress UspA family protein
MEATGSTERFAVLAALDGSWATDDVVRASANFAQSVPRGELHLVHVVEDMRPFIEEPGRRSRQRASPDEIAELARAQLRSRAAIVRGEFGGPLAIHVAVGSAWKQVLQVAMDIQADVIVIGASGRHGYKRLALGSVTDRVARSASCPVVVVREKDYHSGPPPEIEPACAACLHVQEESCGARLWCEAHAAASPRGHMHDVIP